MTRTTPSRVDSSSIGPTVARVPILFLLVNVPALVLMMWLGFSLYSAIWVKPTTGIAPLQLPWGAAVAMLAGVAGGSIGNLLLYRRIAGVTSRLARTLNEK